MVSRNLNTVMCCAVLCVATSASAAPRIELGVGLGLGESGTVGKSTGITPEITVGIPLSHDMDLVVDWGLTWVTTEAAAPLEQTAIALQNPFIGLEMTAYDDDTRIRFRPGITLPVSSFTDDPNLQPAQTVAFNMARGTYGMRKLWRHLPENTSLVGTVEVDFGSGSAGQIRTWLDVAFAFPTTESDPDADLIFETGFGWRTGPVFIDLSAVWMPTNDGDNAQVALRPGLAFGLGGARVELAANLNLDAPFDSFSDGGVLGAELRVAFGLGGGGHATVGDDPPDPSPEPEPEPDPIVRPDPPKPPEPTPHADPFTRELQAIVQAFPDGFQSIRGAEVKDEGGLASIGKTWVSTRCLPEASECMLYLGLLKQRPNFYAVMIETTDEAQATRLYESLSERIAKAELPFAKVRLDDSRLGSHWSQSFIPFGADDRWEGIVIEVERSTNPVMKVGDSFQRGWSVYVRVNYLPPDDDDDEEEWW